MHRNISAVVLTTGKVPDLTREPRASPEPRQLVEVREVPRAALQVALRLAQGDTSRLIFDPDGTVTVGNSPRPAQRTQEPRR
jgi:hypothetical protein